MTVATASSRGATNPIEAREASSTPVLDVVCSGDAFEMGARQGEALSEKIAGTLSSLRGLEVFRRAKPMWIPFGVFRRIAERRIGRLWSILDRISPAHAHRLDGIAAGAGLSSKSIRLLNALEPWIADLDGKAIVPPPGACCAVAVRGRRSSTESPIVARNFDYLPLIQPYYAVRECRPREGFRSLEFTIAPLAGAVDGMNENGLTITYDYAYVRDCARFGPSISMAISAALARCRTVAEAVDFLGSFPRWGGGILMLADASGDIASLELSNSKHAVRCPTRGADHLFHTNRFRAGLLSDVEVDDDTVFAGRSPRALRGRRVHDSSDLRDRRFADLFDGDERLSANDLERILADHGPENEPGDATICTHGSYWYTTATLQFFPRDRRMRVAYDTACRPRFVDFEL